MYLDAIIIGAGFSGLYQLYKCRDQLGLKTLVIEEGKEVGGTWYWNKYPGSRCDTESHIYCYTFSEEIYKNWKWKERYPKQKEILSYLKYVERKLSLRKDIIFNNKVISADYLDKKNLWRVKTDKKKVFYCKYLISAVGSLSAANIPNIKGIKSFKGEWYHSGRWPDKKISFKNQKVAQIGTGSSGIQIAPVVAKSAKSLTVFQRTPNYSVPARNRKLTKTFIENTKKNYKQIKNLLTKTPGGHAFQFSKKSIFDFNESKRLKILEKAWLNGGLSFRACFSDITKKLSANKIVSNYITEKINNIVKDKEVAKQLTDFGHPFTSKRPTLNTDYFETFNKKNVRLIDLKENPIVNITKNGIKTKNEEFKFDKIIFATGYDALSGPILSLNLTGRKNIKLNKYWKNGPITYLGLMIPNFPNFFIISGPGSPSVLTNVPAQIQQHVEWISEFIRYLEKSNSLSVEPEAKEAENWVKKINTLAKKSLFMKAKNSWYKGDNIPGKPKTFIPYPAGLPQYREICNKVRKKMYKGFNISLK